MGKTEVSLWPPIGFGCSDESPVVPDRRIDADVFLERGEIENDPFTLECRNVAADTAYRLRQQPFHLGLDVVQPFAWLRIDRRVVQSFTDSIQPTTPGQWFWQRPRYPCRTGTAVSTACLCVRIPG